MSKRFEYRKKNSQTAPVKEEKKTPMRKRANTNAGQKKERKRQPRRQYTERKVEKVEMDEALRSYLARNPGKSAKDAVRLVKMISTAAPTLNSSGATDSQSTVINRSFNKIIKVTPLLSIEAIYGWATAFLSYAYKLGYLQYCSQSGSTSSPGYAWNFIVLQLLGAANNVITADTSKNQIPRAMCDIMAALAPKKDISFPQGSVAYSWSVPSNPSPLNIINYPLSSTATGGYFRMWEVGPSLSGEGYNTMQPPTGFSYTAEVGAAAFNDMCSYMNGAAVKRKAYSGLNLVTYDIKKSPLSRSVSVFAANSTVIGDGDIGGAFNALASLELPRVDHPLFSVFTTTPKTNNRTFNSHHPTGGDANYLSAVQITAQSAKHCKNKIYPVFKPIDIYEFIHRMALVVVDIFQKAYNDQDIRMQYPNLGMTHYDFAIMIYQQLMLTFSDTQIMCQSVLPYRGATSSQFTPFIIDSAQSANSANSVMVLPKFANLNLQALRPRSLATTIDPKNGKSVRYNQRHWIPMWGQYSDWSFVADDYFYQAGDEKVLIFLPSSDSYNLYNNTVNSGVVDMGNSTKIFDNVTHYNRVMSTYSAYIQEQEKINNEPGPDIFEVIGETLILKEIVKKNKDKKKNNTNNEKEKKPRGPTVTIKDKVIVAVTSQKPVISEVYSQLLTFVKPEIQLYTPSGTSSGAITTQSWQIFSHETSLGQAGSSAAGDVEFLDINVIRSDFVTNCTKNRGGNNAAIVDIAMHFDTEGKGGLLDTVAGIAGNVLQNFVGLAPLMFV